MFNVAYRYERIRYVSDVRPERYDNIKLLIEQGYDLNQADSNGNTPLHIAAYKGDINIIYLLIENGADLTTRNNNNETPLHAAIYYSGTTNTEAVNLLLHLGADYNATGKQGKAPLEYAIEENSWEIVDYLLQHGAEPTDEILEYAKSKINQGKTAQRIVLSIEDYKERRAKAILQGADLDRLSFEPPPPPSLQFIPAREDSPLIIAVEKNDLNEVKKLILLEVELDAYNKEGSTALHKAIRLNREEIVKVLIEAGSNLSLKDRTGHHPLYIATYSPQFTQLLLDNGASVDRETVQNKMTALTVSNNLEVSRILLENGADINHESKRKVTPLIMAIRRENSPMIEFLLERGANTNLFDGDNPTALFFELEANQFENIELLMNYMTNKQKTEFYKFTMSTKRR